jgi:hypothetical protein
MQNSSSLDIVRRIAERGLKKAQEDADDPCASHYVDVDSYVDLFQHLLDELERIK